MAKRLTTEEFIKRAKEIHGENRYCYSNTKYVNSNTKVEIYCPKCDRVFWRDPASHLKGYECQICANKRINRNKTMTTEEFIKLAKSIHGEKYDYSEANYINSKVKVKIYCKQCKKFFWQDREHHIGRKQGCKCNNTGRVKKTTEEFIAKAKSIHGNKYKYDKVNYTGWDNRIKIFCIKCNRYFLQRASGHLIGSGCPTCADIYVKELKKQSRSDTKDFIKKAKKVHGRKYDYSLVEYKTAILPVKIRCLKHGIFEQTPNIHLSGSGCKLCNNHKPHLDQRYTLKQFIYKAKQIHGNKYRYDRTNYILGKNKIEIYCRSCQKYFFQRASSHIRGQNCPNCRSSKGELKIEKWLKDNDIFFSKQYRIKGCKHKIKLPFDFAIFEDKEKIKLKYLIEMDGEGHYIPIPYGNISKEKQIKNLKGVQFRDNIKNNFCNTNNIDLIRIPYWEKKNINKILENKILKG